MPLTIRFQLVKVIHFAIAMSIVCNLPYPASAFFGQSFVRMDGTHSRDRSQRSTSLFSSLQASAQLGLGDASVLQMLGCPPSTQSLLRTIDSLVAFEGVAIANVTHFDGYQRVAIDVWGGRNAADSYLVCTVKASLPISSNDTMQLISVSSGYGHAASNTKVQNAAAYMSSFRTWLGGDPFYASTHNYRRFDDFVPKFGQAFARLLPDAPCAMVTFGESGVSSTARYRMTFHIPYHTPPLTASDFWVAPTLLASFQSSFAPATPMQSPVVRGNKYGVRTSSADEVFLEQPNTGCCPVATVPSTLYPGRCVLCSEHIVSGAKVAAWQPLNGSTQPPEAACSLPFKSSAATCVQSTQTCSCRFICICIM
jgi:hypothetical protein